MKVYSLYYEGKTYVCSFPTRQDCINYGKQHYDGWQCDIVEEYLSRTPMQLFTSPSKPYNPLPTTPPWTLIPQLQQDCTQTPKLNDVPISGGYL
jgi:hypothetical protein